MGTVAQRKTEGQARRCRRHRGRWNRGFPEDTSVKKEIEGALKRAEAQESAAARADPDTRTGAASDKVARLEQAIAAMRNYQGPELDVLVAALKKAQKESSELPWEAQI